MRRIDSINHRSVVLARCSLEGPDLVQDIKAGKVKRSTRLLDLARLRLPARASSRASPRRASLPSEMWIKRHGPVDARRPSSLCYVMDRRLRGLRPCSTRKAPTGAERWSSSPVRRPNPTGPAAPVSYVAPGRPRPRRGHLRPDHRAHRRHHARHASPDKLALRIKVRDAERGKTLVFLKPTTVIALPCIDRSPSSIDAAGKSSCSSNGSSSHLRIKSFYRHCSAQERRADANL